MEATFLLLSLANTTIWIATLGVYLANQFTAADPEAPLSGQLATAAFVLLAIDFAIATASYLAWQFRYGQPNDYLTGASLQRLSLLDKSRVHRFGVYAITSFLTTVTMLFSALVLEPSYSSLTVARIPLLTPISNLAILQASVALDMVRLFLLLYVYAPQFYTVPIRGVPKASE